MLQLAHCTQSPSPPLSLSPSMGSLVSAAEAAAAAAATAAAAAARAAAVAAAACHYCGPGVVAAAGPGVATLHRLAPTCPAAEPLPVRRRVAGPGLG